MIERGESVESAVKSFKKDTPLGYVFQQKGVIEMIKEEFNLQRVMELNAQAAREEGREEGREELILNAKKNGLTDEQISAFLSIPIEKVKSV